MGRTIKDAVITKTQTYQLTAEITGTGGRRAIIIYLDREYADSLHEWLDAWYDEVDNTGPKEGQEKIGSTPEEALDWWARSRGFTFLEEKAVLEVVVDPFNTLRGHVWISKVPQKIVRIDPGQFVHHQEYIGKEVEIVEKKF